MTESGPFPNKQSEITRLVEAVVARSTADRGRIELLAHRVVHFDHAGKDRAADRARAKLADLADESEERLSEFRYRQSAEEALSDMTPPDVPDDAVMTDLYGPRHKTHHD